MSRAITAQRQPDHSTQRPMTGIGIVGVLTALAVGVLLASCAQTTIAGALPEITGDIGTIGDMSWPVTAYLVMQAVTTLVFGKLATIDNPRPVYLVAMGAFLAGAVFAGIAPTFGQLMISRAIQGIGAGGLLALGFEVVGELVRPRWRVRYRSCLALVWAIGTLLGPFLGGLITEHVGWPWVFYVNVPVGLIVLLVVTAGLRLPHRSREGDLDLVGAVLLTLELILVLLYVSWQGPLRGWISGGGVVILAETVAALVLLLAWESRVKEPLLPLHLLRRSAFRKAALTAVLVGSALFGVLVLFPLHAQVVLHTTPAGAGFLVLPMAIAALVGAIPFFRVGWHRVLLMFGTGAVVASMALLFQQPVNAARSQTLVFALTAGLGLGVVWRLAVHIARSAIPPDAASKAIPAILFLQTAGCAIGAALACSVLSLRLARYRGANLLNATGLGPDMIRRLPDLDRDAVLGAFEQAGRQVLLTAAVITAVAFLLSCTVRTVPLRGGAALAEAEPEPVVEEPEPERVVTEPEPVIKAEPEPITEAEPKPVTEAEPEPLFDKPTVPESQAAPIPRRPPPQPPTKRTEPLPKSQTPPRKRRRSPIRRLVVVNGVMLAVLAAGYCAGLLYAGPGILRGTTVNGVEIGGLQPAQAEQKLDRALGPVANAPIPVQVGNQTVTVDPHTAGLSIDVRATVASMARRSDDPIRLANTLLHAPRRREIRTTIDGARLHSALTQVDQQVHRDPRDGTITFGSGTPQVVRSQDGQSLDIPRAAVAIHDDYMRGPVALPLMVLHPKVSNDEVQRAMRDFAEPAVSGPVMVSADGKIALLPPSVFAAHLSVSADANGRLYPEVDGAGVLNDASTQLGPLQTQPQPGSGHLVDGTWIQTPPRDGHVIRAEDLAGSMLRVLPQRGDRVAYVALTTVHP